MLRSLMLRCAQRRRTSYFSISATAPPVGKQCKGERQWEGQPQKPSTASRSLLRDTAIMLRRKSRARAAWEKTVALAPPAYKQCKVVR